MRLGTIIICLALASCGADENNPGPVTPTNLDPGCTTTPEEAECDAASGRAVLCGSFDCESEPESVRIEKSSGAYDIFTYEASHPLASAAQAFPCAASQGNRYEAPNRPTQACSVAGVRPWHSVRWDDASVACTNIGWRICTGSELERACGGPNSTAYTFGSVYENGVCNLREAFRGEGTQFASSSPTGHFEGCISAENAYDLTGNLWEWTSDVPANDSSGHIYQGAGWKTIAERHRDINQVCSERSQLTSSSAVSFASPFVGFRCCRDAN